MRQLHKINNRQKVMDVYAGKKKSRIKQAEQNQNKLKHRGTLHKEERPRRLPQAPGENLTFWAGTGILLPRCLPPAHIGEEKKKTLICFNVGRIQRLAFCWFDCRRQRKSALLLHVAVTTQELIFCLVVT